MVYIDIRMNKKLFNYSAQRGYLFIYGEWNGLLFIKNAANQPEYLLTKWRITYNNQNVLIVKKTVFVLNMYSRIFPSYLI